MSRRLQRRLAVRVRYEGESGERGEGHLQRRGAVADDGRERQHGDVYEVQPLAVLPDDAVVLAVQEAQ